MAIQIIESSSEVLSVEARAFLERINQAAADVENDPGIPVYLRQGNNFLFLKDFILKTKANHNFEKGAAVYSFYRGGAVVVIKCHFVYKAANQEKYFQVFLIVADDRYGFHKPITGIANHAEGLDLVTTAFRELGEEGFLFTLDTHHRSRIVPKGFKKASHHYFLNIKVVDFLELGELKLEYYTINENNRALEAVLLWDLEILEAFSYIHDEDWEHLGITAYAMDVVSREIVGVFSGQQGFIPLSDYGLHSTLQDYINKKS